MNIYTMENSKDSSHWHTACKGNFSKQLAHFSFMIHLFSRFTITVLAAAIAVGCAPTWQGDSLEIIEVSGVPAGGDGEVSVESGGPLPAALSMPDLTRLLLARSPELAAERAGIDISHARRIRAAAFPRPELSIGTASGISGENTVDGRTHEYLVRQPLPVFGQRDAVMRDADLEIQASEALFRVAVADAVAEAREVFVELLAAEHRLRALVELQADLEESQSVVAERVGEGLQSSYDQLRIDIEIAETESLIRIVRGDRDDASARLAALFGESAWSPRPRGNLRPLGVPQNESRLWTHAKDALAPLIAARQAGEAARKRIDLARRKSRPVPVVDAGVIRTTDPGSHSGYLGFGIELPFFDTPRIAVDEARAEAAAADRRFEAAMRTARADLARSIGALKARRHALDHFEDSVIGPLPELRRMSAQAYEEGEIGITELLGVFQSLLDARLEQIDHIESVLKAESDVLAAAGMLEFS